MEKKLKLIIPWSNSPGVRKMLLYMKLTSVIFLVAVLQTWAAVSYSQTTTLSVNLKNATVQTVLQQVEDQSEFYFLYSRSVIDVDRTVDVQLKNAKISEVLNTLFIGTDVAYKVEGRQIVLSKKSENSPTESQQQQKSVSGKVTDSSGASLPGVSVVVKGTTNGTITDANGNFSFSNVPENGTLQFSFVGMKAQEVVVGGKTTVNVKMEEETVGIEEVVAVGYGTMKKVNLTGSISSVKAEDLTKVPQPTLTQAIMGRVSGMFIKNVNGQPGESKISYNIRGFGSPLLIIDGLPATDDDFKRLDPNDVEDFSILKDAASAAVYGSRAGNGVILIKTKRGKISDAKMTYTGNYGLQFFAVVPDFVSSEMYARMENLSRYNQGLSPVWTNEEIQKFGDGSDPNKYPNTDWWDEALRKFAPQTQHNLNVRGGTDRVKYFVSGGYFSQRALTRADDTRYNKYTLRSNLDISLTEKLDIGVDISMLYQDFMGPVHQVERTSSKEGVMGNIFRSQPYYTAQYPDPTKLVTMGGYENSPTALTMEHGGYRSRKGLTSDIRLTFAYELPFGFEAKANYRVYQKYARQKQFEKKTPTYSYDWDTGVYKLAFYLNDPSRLYESIAIDNAFDQQYYLTWDKKVGKHNVNALGVFEILSDNNNWFDASRIRYEFDIDYLFAGPDLDKNNNGRADQGGRVGLITRVNYDYEGKYLAEFNSRYDASPRFPKDTRWGFFPSASVAWRLSEESFIKDNLRFVTNLKLRATHGKLGYDNTGNFQYLETYSITTQYIYDEMSNQLNKGMRADAMPNRYITWEKMTTSNIGLDFNLWQSLLEGSLDYFYRLRTDVLGSKIQSLPNIVGASMPQVNYAEYDNRGVELSLNHKHKIGDFEYSFGGNVSWNREKRIYADQNLFANREAWRTGNQNGEWTDRWWGRKTAGLFQTKEEIENWADQDGRNNATILPGDVKYVDYNGDGRITNEDNIIIGRGTFPKLMYGINGSMSWKGFDFSMLWQGAGLYDFNLGNAPDYRLVFYAGNTPMMHMLTNSYIPEGNPWLPANTSGATLPLFRTDNYNRNHPSFASSDFWLVNGSYIRLKTVELGYNLPEKLIGKWNIDNCKVYLSGSNLLTFSHYKYLDPEVDTSPARVMGDYYPPVGTYNIGIILQF